MYPARGRHPNLGDPITVTVAKPFTFVPILNIGTITIRASSTMRIEKFQNGADAHLV